MGNLNQYNYLNNARGVGKFGSGMKSMGFH